MPELPTVDIVTVFYNGAKHIAPYLQAIKRMDYPAERYHLYLVDNASTDWTALKLAQASDGLSRTMIPLSLNSGFTGGCNVAMRAGSSEYILLLNPDTKITPDALRLLVERAQLEPGIGIVEAPRGTLTHHYVTDEKGIIKKANLIVATVNNAAAINMSVKKAAQA
ncbi:MAG: glycosyltransferase, partial [Parcubacteria group bacterium]